MTGPFFFVGERVIFKAHSALTDPTMNRTLLLLIACLSFGAHAEVYKSVDKYGNVTYTDDPSKAARSGETTEKVQVRPTNLVPGGKPIDLTDETQEEPEQEYPDYQVQIVSPTNEYTVTAGQRDLVIAVSTQVPLQAGHRFAYYMDGERLNTTTLNNHSIREIFRGQHTLRVDVVDADDQTITSSESVTVFVHRPSIN